MHGEFYGVLETYIGHCRVINLVLVVVDLVDDDIVVIVLQLLRYVVATVLSISCHAWKCIQKQHTFTADGM